MKVVAPEVESASRAIFKRKKKRERIAKQTEAETTGSMYVNHLHSIVMCQHVLAVH